MRCALINVFIVDIFNRYMLPSTGIPFKFTYACRLLVIFRGRMFPITLHVQLLYHYGYRFYGYSS